MREAGQSERRRKQRSPPGVAMELKGAERSREEGEPIRERGGKTAPPSGVAMEIERQRRRREEITWGEVDQSEAEERNHAPLSGVAMATERKWGGEGGSREGERANQEGG